ncbi:hypothetical protein NLI96_g1623 [Meripilus lineatus]|uniref:Uncharacterized protein n=1 Tax=Meripilus lineatus TaxID=2056292 RepID=A0AAD5VAG6_9APHY|nr:hypothetical protein NLI96_g1623 [Physisporinus lineatus]
MARATRSATSQEPPKQQDSPSKTRKAASKKRKRLSVSDATDLPLAKQPRTDGVIKEEDTQEPDDTQHPSSSHLDTPSSGDVPLQQDTATKILDILEAVDTQGLLDRVFPLASQSDDEPTSPTSAPGSSSSAHSHSLRSLLKDPSTHPLRVLRSAVQHLLPISSHPRSRPSATVAEQLRFCNLVSTLLDQASSLAAPISLDAESIISEYAHAGAGPSGTTPSPTNSRETLIPKRKYALVQRLPTGDWWSSTNSGILPDGKELSDLPTANAELVAIFPSSSFTPSSGHDLTLAEYVKPSPTVSYYPHEPRRVPCGRFLDYGPYASFAPTFDQEGTEVGRVGLGETIWYQQRKRKAREQWLATLTAAVESLDAEPTANGVNSDPSIEEVATSERENEDLDSLNALLPPDQVKTLKSVLGNLQLEEAVQELLTRNARALERLEELQLERLGGENGGSSTVDPNSEEWEVGEVGTELSLKAVQQHIRDDSTVHVKIAGIVPPVPTVPATPAATAAPSTPVTKQQAPTTPYNYGAYTGYNAGQYRGGYGSYNSQSGGYYSNYAQQQTATGAAHYSGTQYNAAAQQQYSYANSWYNYQHNSTSTTQAGGTSSGRATPQPIAPSTSYNGYVAPTTQPQAQRAVANTVVTTPTVKGYQPGAWPNGQASGSNFVAPTLPAHLRTSGAAAGSAPGTPATATAAAAASSYAAAYAGYATTQFVAR